MATEKWQMMVEALKQAHGVKFADGLTDDEVRGVELRYGFRFPPDLREFLQAGLPISDGFPDWRNGSPQDLQQWLDTPLDGILFDVQHNGFWLPEWGQRPVESDEAAVVVRQLVKDAPTLIPVCQHRMIPDRPHLAGNPVFSVHQTDIIYYGCDLRDYFLHEFLCVNLGWWPMFANSIRKIEFWDLDRFATRWDDGPIAFDNSKGQLP
jgi:hypothetical protein